MIYAKTADFGFGLRRSFAGPARRSCAPAWQAKSFAPTRPVAHELVVGC
jgi:hypothetical protein